MTSEINLLDGPARAESIALWLEHLADVLTERARGDPLLGHHHQRSATLYRARASDIRADLDLPDPAPHTDPNWRPPKAALEPAAL